MAAESFHCCFCYEVVSDGERLRIEVSLPAGVSTRQYLGAHADCLAEHLDPRVTFIPEVFRGE